MKNKRAKTALKFHCSSFLHFRRLTKPSLLVTVGQAYFLLSENLTVVVKHVSKHNKELSDEAVLREKFGG